MQSSPITATFGTVPLEMKAATSGVSSPEPWFVAMLGGGQTAAGVRVGPTSAMTVPAVKRAVDLIGSTVGALPVRVLKLDAAGGQVPATDHPAFGLVYRNSNGWTSARKFRETLTRDALLTGNGYAAVIRVDGQPRELIRLAPGAVSVALDERTQEPVYSITIGGTVEVLSWRDVLHVAAPSLDGVVGASPVHLGREAIGLALTLEAHAARLFGNGARPGLALTFPNKLGQEGADRMKAGWHAAFNGAGSGGTAILEEGGDVKQLTLTSVDAQFAEMRGFQVREIANIFGVPSTMLNDLSKATFSNAEALGQAFRDETVMPWVVAWESAYERALLVDTDDQFSIAFDLDDLDRADMAAKAEAMSKRRAAGVTTANDERARLNMPAAIGGDAIGSPFTTSNTSTPPEATAS